MSTYLHNLRDQIFILTWKIFRENNLMKYGLMLWNDKWRNFVAMPQFIFWAQKFREIDFFFIKNLFYSKLIWRKKIVHNNFPVFTNNGTFQNKKVFWQFTAMLRK